MLGQAFKNLGNVDSRTVSVSNGVTLSKVIYPQSRKLRILPGVDVQHDSRISAPKISSNVDRRSILQEPEGRSNVDRRSILQEPEGRSNVDRRSILQEPEGRSDEKRILINVNTDKFPFQGARTDECKLKPPYDCMGYPYPKNTETTRYGFEGEKITVVKKPDGTIITTVIPPPSRGIVGTLLYWIFG